jgi:uncharacterized Ntn-hydrolase superfamily protein
VTPVAGLVVTGSRALAEFASAERWALDALHDAVALAGTVVTGDARGPDSWALTVARTTGRRWASYTLDGRALRGHGVPVPWTPDAPPERRDGRALWAAWCLHRDRAIVRDAARAHAAGRSVRVLALVAPWSATHGTAYTVARARSAGLEVVVRAFGRVTGCPPRAAVQW